MADAIRVAVVMAGGAGERFWPLSRRHRPKQLLPLGPSGQPLLRDALERIGPLFGPDRIWILTSRELVEPIRAAAAVPPERVVGEPCRRNTGGCLAYAAALLLGQFGPSAERVVMAVLPSDHAVGDTASFRATLEAALAAAERHDALVTVGIRPDRPAPGFGYLEVDAAATNAGEAWPVRAFHEKPDRLTAERYTASGRHYWNSGMFFWRLSYFLAELEHAAPALAEAARTLAAALADGDAARVETVFAALEDRSIDCALMERARRVLMIPARFAWDDLGSWDALDRVRPRDADGNVALGDPVLIDVRESIVVNAPGAGRMAVAAVGVRGVAIVVTEDAVLVVPKERAQDVRDVVRALRDRGAPQL